jgi:hypothetical protein
MKPISCTFQLSRVPELARAFKEESGGQFLNKYDRLECPWPGDLGRPYPEIRGTDGRIKLQKLWWTPGSDEENGRLCGVDDKVVPKMRHARGFKRGGEADRDASG